LSVRNYDDLTSGTQAIELAQTDQVESIDYYGKNHFKKCEEDVDKVIVSDECKCTAWYWGKLDFSTDSECLIKTEASSTIVNTS